MELKRATRVVLRRPGGTSPAQLRLSNRLRIAIFQNGVFVHDASIWARKAEAELWLAPGIYTARTEGARNPVVIEVSAEEVNVEVAAPR